MKYLYLLAFLCLILNLSACATVKLEKSAFDGSLTLTMVQRQLDNKAQRTIGLNWDATMPKDSSLAKIILYMEYLTTSDTSLNINVDGEIFKIKLTDTNKSSDRTSDFFSGQKAAGSVYRTILYANIPDKVISKISKSDKTVFMLNFANNEKLVIEPNILVKMDFRDFYSEKNRLIQSMPDNKSVGINPVKDKSQVPQLPQPTNDTIVPATSIQQSNSDSILSMIVISNNTNLRKTPSKNSAVIKSMQKGQKVNFIKQKDDWIMVELSSGDVGWCHQSLLTQNKY